MPQLRPLSIPSSLILATVLWNRYVVSAAPNASTGPLKGTVAVVRTSGKNIQIIVRSSSPRSVTLTLGATARVSTLDNNAMRPIDIQLGDQVLVFVNHRVQDTSQRRMQLSGIVSFAPGESTGSMAVKTAGNGDIAVNLDTRTQYADSTHQTTGLAEVEEADEVRLVGIVDLNLGEMTHTQAVRRLGPANRKSQSQGGTYG